MKRSLLLLSFSLFLSLRTPHLHSQTTASLMTVRELREQIHRPTTEWALPLPVSLSDPLIWKELPNSFTDRGIRTFGGYSAGVRIASLSIDQAGLFSGSITLQGNSYQLTTNALGYLSWSRDLKRPHRSCLVQAPQLRSTVQAQPSASTSAHPASGLSDGIYRKYRLAILFSRDDFESPRINKSREQVRLYLAGLETYLNEIYVRDLGVQFVVLNDDRLIDTKLPSYQVKVQEATKLINERIGGPGSYDVGVALNYDKNLPDLRGWGYIGHINTTDKGGATVGDQDYGTIAHELGHLFGGYHTFATKVNQVGQGIGSEPGMGQSVMSYGGGYLTDFLSLITLEQMQAPLHGADALHPVRVPSVEPNTPPVIDRSKLKALYIVPEQTFFSITIPASDREQKELYYSCNQANFSATQGAHFPARPPQRDPRLDFGVVYSGASTIITNSDKIPRGEYQFLLSVSDAPDIETAMKKHQAPLYDTFVTTVRVVPVDKPFRLTSPFKSVYKAGEKLTLRWDVDPKFFAKESQVRILFSDDEGKSYSHILSPATANDGECEVVLPQTLVGQKTFQYAGRALGKGLIRVEVIGEGLYCLSPNNPIYKDEEHIEGIQVQPSGITFINLPESNYLRIGGDDPLPAPPAVAARHESIDLPCEYSEVTEGLMTTRRWQAKWEKEEAAYVLFIERTTPPTAKPTPEPPTPPKKEEPKPQPELPIPPKKEEPKPQPEPPIPPKKEEPKPQPEPPIPPKEEEPKPQPEPPIPPKKKEETKAPSSVKIEAGKLLIQSSQPGQSVTVWSMTGKLLARYQMRSIEESFPLPVDKHLIVRVGKEVFKLSYR